MPKANTDLPDQCQYWNIVAHQTKRALWADRQELARLSGIDDMFDEHDKSPSRYKAVVELIRELVNFCTVSMAEELDMRTSESAPRRPGRLENQITRYLGPRVVTLYWRYRRSEGRNSVLTSVDGKLTQMEAGPLFEFVSRIVLSLNRILVGELNLRPLSPARVTRYGLAVVRNRLEPVL